MKTIDSEIYARLLAMRREALADHELEAQIEAGPIAIYRIGPRDSARYATVIACTGVGIALLGDHTPTMPGTVSAVGCTAAWFAGRMHPHHLASKFLLRRWVRSLAREEIRAILDAIPEGLDAVHPGRGGTRKAWEGALDATSYGEEAFFEAATSRCLDTSDGRMGVDYDPAELASLVSIQERFAELMQEREQRRLEALAQQEAAR